MKVPTFAMSNRKCDNCLTIKNRGIMKTMMMKSLMLAAMMSVSTVMMANNAQKNEVRNDKKVEMRLDADKYAQGHGHDRMRPGRGHDRMMHQHSRECARRFHKNKSHRRCDCRCHDRFTHGPHGHGPNHHGGGRPMHR